MWSDESDESEMTVVTHQKAGHHLCLFTKETAALETDL